MNKKIIYYVIEQAGWVQHKRVAYFRKYQDRFSFRVLTPNQFLVFWKTGFLKRKPVYFSSWRVVHGLLKSHGPIFKDEDFNCFLAAVTSHSNIGGGLDPLNPIPGRSPEEAYRLSTELLRKFKAVTVNSLILEELLSPAVKNLLYCPNGVDETFFYPLAVKRYEPEKIRIGWLGKERGPKNSEVIEEAFRALEATGHFTTRMVKVAKTLEKIPLSQERVRDFYWDIDFYLCASFNEGTPNPALEAASCGVPVVTTRVGNMPQLIQDGENGFFIEPTVSSILETFERVRALSKDQYFSLSHAMRAAILSDWTWKKRVGGFLKALERLVS